MTVSEARAALPQILDRVLAGDEVALTRHGEPVAVVARPELAAEVAALDADDDDRDEMLAVAGLMEPLRAPR